MSLLLPHVTCCLITSRNARVCHTNPFVHKQKRENQLWDYFVYFPHPTENTLVMPLPAQNMTSVTYIKCSMLAVTLTCVQTMKKTASVDTAVCKRWFMVATFRWLHYGFAVNSGQSEDVSQVCVCVCMYYGLFLYYSFQVHAGLVADML